LKRHGLSEAPQRGLWRITAQGLELSRKYAALSPQQVEELASVDKTSRLRPLSAPDGAEQLAPATAPLPVVESPDDRLESALHELTASVADDLLEAILQNSPEFFEALVLDLLHALGYGTSRKDLERVGKAGDGGIDGIISLDRLGLEKVYVQAKRWQGGVGRPDVQAFYGALAGQRAKKGVFITTSTFSAQAVEFAKSVDVVLVDGARLTSLMIEHGVGVTHRTVRVPKVDSDYFEE
jgi:restriction system protein